MAQPMLGWEVDTFVATWLNATPTAFARQQAITNFHKDVEPTKTTVELAHGAGRSIQKSIDLHVCRKKQVTQWATVTVQIAAGQPGAIREHLETTGCICLHPTFARIVDAMQNSFCVVRPDHAAYGNEIYFEIRLPRGQPNGSYIATKAHKTVLDKREPTKSQTLLYAMAVYRIFLQYAHCGSGCLKSLRNLVEHGPSVDSGCTLESICAVETFAVWWTQSSIEAASVVCALCFLEDVVQRTVENSVARSVDLFFSVRTEAMWRFDLLNLGSALAEHAETLYISQDTIADLASCINITTVQKLLFFFHKRYDCENCEACTWLNLFESSLQLAMLAQKVCTEF